jgi:hypothetical protein
MFAALILFAFQVVFLWHELFLFFPASSLPHTANVAAGCVFHDRLRFGCQSRVRGEGWAVQPKTTNISCSPVNRGFTNPLKTVKTSFPYVMAIFCCYRVTMLDPIHARAICEEIGYRLRLALPASDDDLPPRLQSLMRELALLDCAAPSLVPSTNDMVAMPEPVTAE